MAAGTIVLAVGLLRNRAGVPSAAEGKSPATPQAVADMRQSSGDEFAPGEYVPCGRQENEYLQPVPPTRTPQELTVVCPLVAGSPSIDGDARDEVWSAAQPVVTLDYLSQRPVTLKSVHTADGVFILVQYPDAAPSTTHKSFRWDDAEGVYKPMTDREDVFLFRWSMVGPEADLLLRHGQPHKADVWFWKAWRSDPVGYADDKIEKLSDESGKDTQKIAVPGRPTMYLQRVGDEGRSTCDEKLALEYKGPFASRFPHRLPDGSRADVRAKGVWRDGVWTIEFARKLDTGHDDDVAFKAGGSYLFVVSCYEVAGCDVNPSLSQPLFNAGDGFDRLLLKIVPGAGE